MAAARTLRLGVETVPLSAGHPMGLGPGTVEEKLSGTFFAKEKVSGTFFTGKKGIAALVALGLARRLDDNRYAP